VFEPHPVLFPDVDFSRLAIMYRAVIQVNRQSFCVWFSSGWEYLLFEWRKDICSEVIAVHPRASWEFINNMESESIPHHGEHELFCVNIMLRLCGNVISG
jgi:hypothetical protein